MGDGEDRVVEEHSGAGVFHDGFDLLTFIAGVAVNLAGAAEGFCFHKGALVSAVQGVGLKLVTDKEQGSSYGIAVKKGENAELLKMLNDGLADIKANGKYDEIINKYISK